jgi:putative flippase GtrA
MPCYCGKFIKQFIGFSLVGVSNTIVLLLVYYFFLWIDSNLYIVGNVLGACMGIVNSFFWISKFVFKNKREHMAKSLLKMCISYLLTIGLQTALLYLMVNELCISKRIAPLINIAVTTPVNFVLNKYWAFRDKTPNTDILLLNSAKEDHHND